MSRPWMPFYVADYKADTAHLSTVEHGAYLLLIMHYWSTGGIPNEEKRLAAIAGLLLDDWRSIAAAVLEFFDEVDGQFRHGRIDAEIAITEEKREKRAIAGQKGGFATAKAKQTSSNAAALPHQSQPQPHKKEPDAYASGPIDKNQPEKKKRGRKPSPKTPLLEGWVPSDGLLLEEHAEFERFKDHARKNDTRYANWDAAWRNWQSSPFNKGKSHGSRQGRFGQTNLADTFREIRSEMGISEDRGDARSVAGNDEKGHYAGLHHIDGGGSRAVSTGDFGVRDRSENWGSKKIG